MVKNNNSNDERIIISFSSFPFAFRAVKCKDFTNYLFDENDFFKKFSLIFRKIVPELEQSNIIDLTKKMWLTNKIRLSLLILELKLNEILSKTYFIILFEFIFFPFKLLFLFLRRLLVVILMIFNRILEKLNEFLTNKK